MTQQELLSLIASSNHREKIYQYLDAAGFTNPQAAGRSISRLTSDSDRMDLFLDYAPQLFTALQTAGDPDRVLATFERFVHGSEDTLAMARFLAGHPRTVETLVRLFSGSQFLSEILLRNPEYFEHLIEYRRLAKPKSREQLYKEARAAIGAEDTSLSDQLDALRRFQRWEMLRIGTCDLLDLFDMAAATLQLSHLADSLVQVCLEIAATHLNCSPSGFAVIGMGKLGGQELNYSSDIDFLFLAAQPSPVMTRLGEHLIDALARVTTEGFMYRVDMRLRPWGKVGPLVSSPDGFVAYLNAHALLWEKQALLKARVVAGDQSVGQDFLQRARPLLFGGPVETVRADVFAMKQRTESFLQQKGRVWGDVKLGEGSIRDVEFVVQFLQLAHGSTMPIILSHNTLDALSRCRAAGLVKSNEFRVLSDGYIFLRTIEHHLQMMDYRQTHMLPDDPEAILNLARRLGFEGEQAGEKFLLRYQQHSAAIRQIYLRYVGRIEMNNPEDSQSPTHSFHASLQEVARHRAQMSPTYVERFSENEIARHAALASQLSSDQLVVVEAVYQPAAVTQSEAVTQPEAVGLPDRTWNVTIVAYDFPGELSLICGLMLIYGLDILKGDVFTYETKDSVKSGSDVSGAPRKIVDVFSVRNVGDRKPSAEMWAHYSQDLGELLQLMRSGQRREAQGMLAKRVGTTLYEANQAAPIENTNSLLPIGIEIDNDSSDQYTLLRINTADTVGFLYELTNALAVNHIYIAQVDVCSQGNQISDILFVTDESGRKITHPERQRELRAATVLIKHFTHLLPHSPNPESALLHFREFISQLFKRTNWPDELSSLERPEVLNAMARLLGVSDFLWDDFLRMQYENLYPVVTAVDALSGAKSHAQLQEELGAILAEVHSGPQIPSENTPWQEALNSFKDREMFRIDMRHILGYTREFWDFAAELTDLTEVIVNAVYHLCHEDLRVLYGTPRLENGDLSEMSVCALGKCGGRELGFASDIELMFIYSGNGRTTGPQVISTTEFYEKLVQNFVRAIRARREGVFEIDLQLRPYGKAGSLSVSLDSFRRYFAPDGPAWPYERQALVKLRPIAGNPELGQKITGLRDSFVFTGESFDVTAMRAMRERQVRHLVTGGMFNLKYSPGGLVDIEYLVQALQIINGQRFPQLRQTNTREAMAELASAGIITPDDYVRLRKAHTFLRWLIDSLRVVRGNARDVNVPHEGSEEFAFLTRRMQYGSEPTRLSEELGRYTADVQEINRRLLN